MSPKRKKYSSRKAFRKRILLNCPGAANGCNRKFQNHGTLANHIFREHKEFAPICEIVKVTGDLTCHVCQTHTTSNLESFKNHIFKDHVPTMDDGEVLLCTKCTAECHTRKDLLDHILLHHLNCVFTCLECHFGDTLLSEMLKHLNQKHAITLKICETCGEWMKHGEQGHQHAHQREE